MLMSPLHPGTIPTGTVMGVHTKSSGQESATPAVHSAPHVVWATVRGALAMASAKATAAVIFPKKRIVNGWISGGEDVLLVSTSSPNIMVRKPLLAVAGCRLHTELLLCLREDNVATMRCSSSHCLLSYACPFARRLSCVLSIERRLHRLGARTRTLSDRTVRQ